MKTIILIISVLTVLTSCTKKAIMDETPDYYSTHEKKITCTHVNKYTYELTVDMPHPYTVRYDWALDYSNKPLDISVSSETATITWNFKKPGTYAIRVLAHSNPDGIDSVLYSNQALLTIRSDGSFSILMLDDACAPVESD